VFILESIKVFLGVYRPALIEGSLGYSQELPNADKGAIPLPENVGTLADRVDTPANLAYLIDRRESTVNSSASSSI